MSYSKFKYCTVLEFKTNLVFFETKLFYRIAYWSMAYPWASYEPLPNSNFLELTFPASLDLSGKISLGF